MPKLSIKDRTSNVAIHKSPPYPYPSQIQVCPIPGYRKIKKDAYTFIIYFLLKATGVKVSSLFSWKRG
jgi:hypothetical protein